MPTKRAGAKPTSSHGGSTTSATAGRRSGGRRPASSVPCQVPGCGVDLIGVGGFYQRYRVCKVHSVEPELELGGTLQRFCQQCARFHPLAAFQGCRRSCQAALLRHRSKRKRSSGSRPAPRRRKSGGEEEVAVDRGGEEEEEDGDQEMEAGGGEKGKEEGGKERERGEEQVCMASGRGEPWGEGAGALLTDRAAAEQFELDCRLGEARASPFGASSHAACPAPACSSPIHGTSSCLDLSGSLAGSHNCSSSVAAACFAAAAARGSALLPAAAAALAPGAPRSLHTTLDAAAVHTGQAAPRSAAGEADEAAAPAGRAPQLLQALPLALAHPLTSAVPAPAPALAAEAAPLVQLGSALNSSSCSEHWTPRLFARDLPPALGPPGGLVWTAHAEGPLQQVVRCLPLLPPPALGRTAGTWVSNGIGQWQHLPGCPPSSAASASAAATAAATAASPVALGSCRLGGGGPAFVPPASQLPPASPFLVTQHSNDDGVEAGIEGWIAGVLSP